MKSLSTLPFSKLLVFIFFLAISILIVSGVLQWIGSRINLGQYDVALRYKNKIDYYENFKGDFEVIVAGSSHAKSIHIESLGRKGINFYDGGGDIEEANFKLSRIIPDAESVKFVIYPLSPGGLLINRSSYGIDKSRVKLMLSNSPLLYLDYLVYPIELVSNYLDYAFPVRDSKSFATDNLITLLTTFRWDENSRRKIHPNDCFIIDSDSFQSRSEDGIIHGYSRNLMKPKCIPEYAEQTVAAHIKMMNNSLSADSNVRQKNMRRVVDIANSLSKRRGKLILFMPPFTREYYESPEIQSLVPAHLSDMNELAKHPAIEFYDYHDFFFEKLDQGENKYFFDDDHLALPGAIEFSRSLKVQLDKVALNL
ncbi:hypothetical protein KI743_06665 [Vibrio sp. D420a]|uniref:hypothetical protein n=1 Tax=Vibrio sp. D420a TaxID=2836895 RepID=UPI002555FAAA|nr:hypothetical protein [Vibrio sp. D420a]MDK9761677.1 hypothetical protein [Vibrio sp. D420a]